MALPVAPFIQPIQDMFLDSPQVDAFNRNRVSNPSYVFDAQLTYNLQPLLFEPITNGSGAAIAHDSTNRVAAMTFASTPTGGQAFLQSYEYFRYQPGRSQFIYLTFNFKEAVANVLKFAGYSDGTNGVEFQLNGLTPRVVLYSGTGNGNQIVDQSNWNVDKLDGTGPSGKTFDPTKIQIFATDGQALYSGRVRCYLDIDGDLIMFHEFLNANRIATPYIQSFNLPIRCGMTCTATVSTTMFMTCCSVMSEGGQDLSDLEGFGFSAEGSATAGSGTQTHLLSIRPKALFNSFVNRVKIKLESIQFLATGTNPIRWQLVIGQAISGTTTFNDVNTTYSAIEYNTAGTISGSPAIVIESGYAPGAGAGAQQPVPLMRQVNLRYPITLDRAGAARSLGTVSLLVAGEGGASACVGAMNWSEVR